MLEEFLRIAEQEMAVFPGRRLRAWGANWHGALEYKDEADFEHLYDALRSTAEVHRQGHLGLLSGVKQTYRRRGRIVRL